MPRSIKVGLVFRPGRGPLSVPDPCPLVGLLETDDGFLFIVFITSVYIFFGLLL